MDHQTIATAVGGIVSAVVAVGTGVMMARRKLSKDTLELAKDRAELDILTHLTTQRDDALKAKQTIQSEMMQADLDKKSAMAKTTQLEQELTQLRQKVALLKQLVSRLSSALELTKQQLGKILDEQAGRSISQRQDIHG